MSQNPLKQSLPFITRDMLAFEEGAVFNLVLQSQGVAAGPFTIRGATKEGLFVFSHTANVDKSVLIEKFRIPDMPIWVSADSIAGTGIDTGECFIRLSLEINGNTIYTLCSGYVTDTRAISWPTALIESPLPNYGRIADIGGANPAAGVECLITVPAGVTWEVMSVRFQLVAAAAAASRVVHVVFQYDGTDLIECISSVAQIISETKNYTCLPLGAAGVYTDDNDILIPIPAEILLRPGDTIVTQTTALNAGDNYGAPRVLVKEYMGT